MKRQILSAALAAVISIGIFSAPAQEYIGSSSIAAAAETVAAPTASKKSGTYSTSGSFSVKLTSSTTGAKIYYSTGGSYKLYTKAISISKSTTLKCYSIKNGVKSKVVTLKYNLVPTVTISKAAGTYNSPVTVKLSSTASGVKFYYTLDGSKPTTSSKLYTTKGITISETSTLRFVTVKTGWTNKYFSRKYVIESPASDESSASGASILDNYTSKYAYNTLTATQKKIYAAIFKAAESHADSADISSLGASASDVEKAYWAFDYENPQFFWLASGYGYTTSGVTGKVLSVNMQYSRSKSEAEKINPQFEAAAKKITDKALKQDNLFDQVKVLHDAIVEMTDYSKTGPSYKSEADGPLLNGVALCEGYSKAFMYLCQSIGIDCICVAGYAGEAHMWNMIKLDGQWYNMDVTWDDPTGGSMKYDYFCIPTSKIKSDHSFDNTFTVPSATATKYSYAEVMGITEYSDVNSAYKGLVKEAAANYKKGVKETTIFFSVDISKELITMMKKNYSFISDLKAEGCNSNGWSGSYTSKSFTVTLK